MGERLERRAGALAVLLAIFLASIAHLLLAGRGASELVATNLAASRADSFRRTIELVHPSAEAGRLQSVALAVDATDLRVDPSALRVQLQVSTAGRWLPLLVLDVGAGGSRLRGILAWLRGDASLSVVEDRGWIDLGPPPPDGAPLRKLVVGLRARPFAFLMPNRPEAGRLRDVTIARVGDAHALVTRDAPRHRLVAAAPVGAVEMAARATFFLVQSPVYGAAAAAALGLLGFGWWALGRHATRGVCALVAGTVLLHAALLPPLQGADATSHAGTIEFLASGRPSVDDIADMPRSIARLAALLEQNRVQYEPGEPLPIAGADARRRLAAAFDAGAADDGADIPRPAAAAVQPAANRAPLFYAIQAGAGRLAGSWPVLDRVALYRLVAAAIALACWCAGALLLARVGAGAQVLLLYAALALLVPNLVHTMAVTANYAPATGLGGLLGAAAVTAALRRGRARAVAVAALLAGALAGALVWTDYLALLPLLGAALLLAGVGWLVRRSPGQRTSWVAGLTALLVLALVGGALLARAAAVRDRLGVYGAIFLPEAGSEEAWWMIALVALPSVAGAIAAGCAVAARREPLDVRRRRALARTAAGWALALALFAVVPFTRVPYETTWLELPDLARAYAAAFFSTNLSLDQDTLTWKLYWAAFGWHDVLYPMPVYALARWALVALFLCLPVLSVRFASRRPLASAALLLLSGVGVSLAVASEVFRQVNLVHPIGRYLMPWLTLAALPALARIAAPGRAPWLRLAVRAGVALHVWTTVSLFGIRYLIGAA